MVLERKGNAAVNSCAVLRPLATISEVNQMFGLCIGSEFAFLGCVDTPGIHRPAPILPQKSDAHETLTANRGADSLRVLRGG
jgi:hypothetical protein